MLVSWYAQILEHFNNAHVLYYFTNSIPPPKKKSICLFLFFKHRKRLVVLYQFILYWYDSQLPTHTRTRVNSRILDAQYSVFGGLFYRSLFVTLIFLSFGPFIVCLISICTIVLLFAEWYMCILSCTGSVSSQITLTW